MLYNRDTFYAAIEQDAVLDKAIELPNGYLRTLMISREFAPVRKELETELEIEKNRKLTWSERFWDVKSKFLHRKDQQNNC